LTVKIKAPAGGDLNADRKLPATEQLIQLCIEKVYNSKVILLFYCKVFFYTVFTRAN
jgi:hypothetical protein